MTIGLVAAMPAEAACLGRQSVTLNQPFRIHDNLLAIVSGIGYNNARKAAEMLQYEQVSGLISWGTATGLAKTEAGDLLLPETVISTNGRHYDTNAAWRNTLKGKLQSRGCRIHTDALAETRRLLETAGQKSALHSETGAIAADMESAMIAKVAHDNHLPCLVVRTVIDRHDRTLPYAITRHTDGYGNTPFLRVLLEVIRQPRLLPRVVQLAGEMRKALKTLKTVGKAGRPALLGMDD